MEFRIAADTPRFFFLPRDIRSRRTMRTTPLEFPPAIAIVERVAQKYPQFQVNFVFFIGANCNNAVLSLTAWLVEASTRAQIPRSIERKTNSSIAS